MNARGTGLLFTSMMSHLSEDFSYRHKDVNLSIDIQVKNAKINQNIEPSWA